MWKNMDVAAFFSASGVEAFVSRMGKDKIGEWERDRKKEHVAVAAIGEVTKIDCRRMESMWMWFQSNAI